MSLWAAIDVCPNLVDLSGALGVSQLHLKLTPFFLSHHQKLIQELQGNSACVKMFEAFLLSKNHIPHRYIDQPLNKSTFCIARDVPFLPRRKPWILSGGCRRSRPGHRLMDGLLFCTCLEGYYVRLLLYYMKISWNTYWCLVGNGWEWGNGIIINNYQ